MPTDFCVADSPTVVPDVQCIIVPVCGKNHKTFGASNWLTTNYGRYFIQLSKQMEKNMLENNELLNTEPILVKAAPGWPTTVDLLFIEDDLEKPKPIEAVVFKPLHFAWDLGYKNVSTQLFRSGKEKYPKATEETLNAFAMIEACKQFPRMAITVVLNALEHYAIMEFQKEHVHFLGYWHEDVKKFLPT